MALISGQDQAFLRDHFQQHLTAPVRIILFTKPDSRLFIPGQPPTYNKETRELLEEVASLSDQITLVNHNLLEEPELAQQYGIERTPAFVLEGAARGKVRFFGIPSGYEFTTLIEDLVDVARGQTDLSEATRAALERLEDDLHIQVFTTPT